VEGTLPLDVEIMAGNLPASEFIGQILQARYRIERQLGQKTGRRTFLATDLSSQKSVVIKLLVFNSEFVWDDLKLFEREAETLKSLQNPAIPEYVDYFEFDLPTLKGFALVQTYIAAPSLEEAFNAGRRFTEAEMRELASALLDILDYLHKLLPPVIHRDIKPSNILISDRTGNSVGTVYLVDFGSVQNASVKEGGTITIVGTYGYMPMEQFGGQTTPASDLYSLGATLIYLLAGVHPSRLPQKDGRIVIPDSQFSTAWRKWLQEMTEPSLQKRTPNVAAAKRSLTVPTTYSPATPIYQPQVYQPQPTALSQFASGPVQFTKYPNSLEIVALDPRYPIPWWLAIVLSLLVLPVPLSIFGFGFYSGSGALFQIALQFSPIFYNFWHRQYGKMLLNIDRNRITSQVLLGNMRMGISAISPVASISKIAFYERVGHFPGNFPQPDQMDQIVITANNTRYRIVSSSPEASELLLKELSDWLELPIEKVR
jgi:serine/threonine protein kinase